MLIELGQRARVAEMLSVSRAQVTHMLDLLDLDAESKTFVLGLRETDKGLGVLTVRHCCVGIRAIFAPISFQK